MGKIIVNRERCKACALCTSACPKKLILFSQEANSQGFYPAELSSEDRMHRLRALRRDLPGRGD